MTELKVYRLKKDTIGHKAGEVFVKIRYDGGRMMAVEPPYAVAKDIDLSKIKHNFDEWFEEGTIKVQCLPGKDCEKYYYICDGFGVVEGWYTVVSEDNIIRMALRNVCFPSRHMAEAAVDKIKLALEQFWYERDTTLKAKPSHEFVPAQKEDE